MAGTVEVLDEILDPGAMHHDPQDPFASNQGPEGARRLMDMYRQAFPDVRFTVEDQVADADSVATRWTAAGTNDGEIMGVPATGREITVAGMTIHRLEGGKIVEGWANWDTLGTLQSLGLSPTPEAEAGS